MRQDHASGTHPPRASRATPNRAGAVVVPARRSGHDPAGRLRLSLPAPQGPHPIGTCALRLTDHRRTDPWVPGHGARELMISLWYPARETEGRPLARHMLPGAAAHHDVSWLPAKYGVPPETVDWAATRTHARHGAPAQHGPRPVVLYSPGAGQPRSWGTMLVEELASHGYVVVTVDHTFEAPEVQFPGGRVELGVLPYPPGAWSPGTRRTVDRIRQDDLRFVLDRLTGPHRTGLPRGLGGAMDTRRIGVFGHGAGGRAALGALSTDARIKAGVDLDGSLGEPPGDLAPVAHHGLRSPFLVLGGQPDGAQPELRACWKTLWHNSSAWRRGLHLVDGTHASFSDAQALLPQIAEHLGRPSDVPPGRGALAATRAYLTAFFDRWLRGARSPLLDGPSARYPEITFVT